MKHKNGRNPLRTCSEPRGSTSCLDPSSALISSWVSSLGEVVRSCSGVVSVILGECMVANATGVSGILLLCTRDMLVVDSEFSYLVSLLRSMYGSTSAEGVGPPASYETHSSLGQTLE